MYLKKTTDTWHECKLIPKLSTHGKDIGMHLNGISVCVFLYECLEICEHTNGDGLFERKAQTDLINSVSAKVLREKEKERERGKKNRGYEKK